MTNEELITEARKGCKESEEMLFKNNQKLIYFVIKQLNIKYNVDDFVSIGNVALFEAYRKFNLNKGVKFSTYAHRAIKNEMVKHLNKITKCDSVEFSFDIKLNSFTDLDYSDTLMLEDVSVQDEFIKIEEKDEVNKVVDLFLKKEKPKYTKLLKLIYLEGKSQIEVSELLGVSRQYINRLKLEIDKKLKEYYRKLTVV